MKDEPLQPEEGEQNIYHEESREALTESDEIDEVEEGFMKGYDEDKNPAECATCKTILEDVFVEEEINGETYRFCSEECAKKFKEKQQHLE